MDFKTFEESYEKHNKNPFSVDSELDRLSADNLDLFMNLSPQANRVLWLFLHTINKLGNAINGSGYVPLSLFYSKDNVVKYMSVDDYFDGLAELIDKGFIARCTDSTGYFINNNLFFRGQENKQKACIAP